MNNIVVSLFMGVVGTAIIYLDNYMNNTLVDNKTYIKYFVLIAILTYSTNWMCQNNITEKVIANKVTKEIFTGNPGF